MKRFLLPPVFLFIISGLNAQLQITSAIVTPSICYNDGTLNLSVSGGTTPYTYSITGGPVLPNVAYPISPDNGSTFLSLHAGSYTVHIGDNAGDSLIYNVIIPGNYAFPMLTDTVHVDSIFLYPIRGLLPDSFSLSSISSNGPFGPYQSSNIYPGLCNGTYYARVKDSCGNFYTTAPIIIDQLPLSTAGGCFSSGGTDYLSIQIPVDHGNPPFTFRIVNGTYDSTNTTGNFAKPSSFSCPDTIYIQDNCGHSLITIKDDCHRPFLISFCSNFSDSSATIVVSGGTPPYVFTFSEFDTLGNLILRLTQDSGHFAHLHYHDINETVQFDIIDACGRGLLEPPVDNYISVAIVSECPYDSIMQIFGVEGAIDHYTITCLNCNPVQTIADTSTSEEFYAVDTGTYYIRATDQCGETRDDTISMPYRAFISATYKFISCNDVVVRAFGSNYVPLSTGVDFSLYVFNTDHWDSLTTNSTGLFQDLAVGVYMVVAHYGICRDGVVYFFVNHFNDFCIAPYFTGACELRLILRFGGGYPFPDDYPETYSLASGNDTLFETYRGPNNGIYFDVTSGVYVLHSDSGCTIPQLEVNFDFELTETHSTDCINKGAISLLPRCTNCNPCYTDSFIYTLDNGSTIWTKYASPFGGVSFTNLAVGTYIARVYLPDSTVLFGDSLLPTRNKTCVLDSVIIEIPSHEVPVFNAQNATVCGSSSLADIPFTISGGLAPYDINIAGFPGIHTYLSSGSLSNIPLGSYTMIVHDTCGISSSLSVSVVDSCVDCDTIHATFSVSRISVCTGDTVFFNNVFDAALSYEWSVNGIVFSHSADTSLIIMADGTNAIKCVIRHFSCSDSFTVSVQANQSEPFELGRDTVYCDAFKRVLSTGNPATVWSTGVTAASITVSEPDTIRAEITSPCSHFSDTIIISRNFMPEIDLGNDSVICNGALVVLRAQLPNDTYTYTWNTGSTADSLLISSAGVYHVTVSSSGCSAEDSIGFTTNYVGDILMADTILCQGETITLTLEEGTNPVWQDGSQFASYTVRDSGTYSVTVQSVCGNISDSVRISFRPCPMRIPDAFTPNGDGLNDYFTVFARGIADYEIRIFNRWGEMVYRSNELNLGWDGTYKGNMQSLGTFVYLITGKTDDGQTFRERATLR